MPIRTPVLDDPRYDRIREDLIRWIPVHAPEWTDHNESDPGITLIELFAHLREQIGYRLDLVPEKYHIELLKLLGVRLKTARAARTRIALLLADPSTAMSLVLPAGSRASAKKGSPPPVFETEKDSVVVPAEPAVLVTTRSGMLWDLLEGASLAPTVPAPPIPADQTEWHSVVWDGKKSGLKEMPTRPIEVIPKPDQNYLWLGLNFNSALDAGFVGVRVTLTVQLDDDEFPDVRARSRCSAPAGGEPAPPRVDWLYYFNAEVGDMRPIPGRIDDSTARLTRSGALHFTVPFSMGPIPTGFFRNLREASNVSANQQCRNLSTQLQAQVGPMPFDPMNPAAVTAYLGELQRKMTRAISDAQAMAANPQPAVAHPLDPKFRDPLRIKGWLRLGPLHLPTGGSSPRLRMAIFNAVEISHATSVRQELLGRSTGRPGQVFQLTHPNVLAGSLEIAVQEERGGLMIPYHVTESLDPAGPFDRDVAVDLEAGVVLFGDGRRGRIPPLIPGSGNIVALRYRHGGGKAGEVDVGEITALESPVAGLGGCVNVARAQGGADAETLEEAKVRARKELATRHRAVTASDFEWIAGQTPEVRVGRTAVVPLRAPLEPDQCPPSARTVRCGPLPSGAAGLNDTLIAHGAVSVVVVPDEEGSEPVPTPSFLRAVCRHLNRHRLVTTELFVVPPQYFRLCNLHVVVKGRPGYTRTQLQDLIELRLARYLHVLTGGESGGGFPFGGQVHAADLIALIFRVEGVERVEQFTALFSRTKSNAVPRQGRLVLCGGGPDDFEKIELGQEETVSVNLESFTLTTVD